MKRILCLIATCCYLMLSCSQRTKQHTETEAYALLEQTAEQNAGGDKQTALQLADSALALHPSDTTRCWLLSEKTVALTDMGRMNDAIQTGKQALDIAEQNGDVDATLNMCGALGIAYRRLGRTDSALVVYKKGIELAVKEQNSEYEIYLNNCITVLYNEEGRYPEALTYAQKAETAALAANDTIERLSARANLGGIFLKQQKYGDALHAVLPVWNEVDSIGYNVLTMKYLSIILKSYAALNDQPHFAQFMQIADTIMPELSTASNGVLGILEIKADMLGRQGKYREQLALLDTLAVMNQTNRAMPEEQLLNEKALCMHNMGRHPEAFSTMALAYHLLDSVKQSDVDNSLSELTVKYQTLEKEMRIEQMKRQQLSLENRILWLAVCVTLLLIIVCVMLYRRKLTRQHAELAQRRSYINGLETERERLAKELHDGVCNDILATTLLLATNSHRAEEQLHHVWKDVRHLSHALMPPRFKDVTLSEAVKAYVNTISDEDEYKITLEVDEHANWKRLSQQQAYETYRIIQEATTNALKHGGAKSIRISLAIEGHTMTVSVVNDVKAEFTTSSGNGIGQETMAQRAAAIHARLKAITENGQHKVELKYELR